MIIGGFTWVYMGWPSVFRYWMPLKSAFISHSGGYIFMFQGSLYRWCLLRRFLRSWTSSRCSFPLCSSSRFIWWTRPTIISQKRLSSFYEDDLPWDSGGHGSDAPRVPLEYPHTGETVLCYSLCQVRQDTYITPFKPFAQFVSYTVTFSGNQWYAIWLWLVVTPAWLPGRAIYLWCFLTSRRCYLYRRMYLVRISQWYWNIDPAHQRIKTVRTRHGLPSCRVPYSRFLVITMLPFTWCVKAKNGMSSWSVV